MVEKSLMDNIGLVAAMPSESDSLLRLVPSPERFRLGSFRAAAFEYPTHHCRLVTSGMGIKHAAAAARLLLETFHPSLLISFGIAGAVQPDMKIGDIIMASGTSMLENGAPGPLHPLTTLSEEAVQELKKGLALSGHAFFTGTAVTTRGSQWTDPGAALLNPILEMETQGIFAAAREKGVPLLVLRSISDGPLSPVPVDLEKALDADYNYRIGGLLLQLLKKPQILLLSSRMIRNGGIAARSAALAVKTVLDLPFDIP